MNVHTGSVLNPKELQIQKQMWLERLQKEMLRRESLSMELQLIYESVGFMQKKIQDIEHMLIPKPEQPEQPDSKSKIKTGKR